jgi:hypothetical protein
LPVGASRKISGRAGWVEAFETHQLFGAALRVLKALTFFGKRDLAFSIDLPEQTGDLENTFWRPLTVVTVNTVAAMRTVCAL